MAADFEAVFAAPFPSAQSPSMSRGSVRVGKAYVSFHLMPLCINPALKADPEPQALSQLKRLTDAAVKQWGEKKWL